MDKQKIAELKQQKRQVEAELDELNGKTAKGKLMSVLAFLLIMAIMAGALVGMVKLNVGGVADNVLAPVIADVPVARSILPKRLQKKNASEIAAQKQAADLKDYVDTYASMDPAQAAAIFDNMMADDIHLVAKILKNMPAKKRADIIANMNTLSAAQITAVMGE